MLKAGLGKLIGPSVRAVALAGVGGWAMVAAANAQAGEGEAQDALVGVLSCRALSDDRDRLACLDSALGELAASHPEAARAAVERSGNVVADGRRDPVDREALFGANDLPRSVTSTVESDELREISAIAISTSRTAGGSLVFVLDNGQVWQQLSSDAADPSVPDENGPYPVTVRRALFGSHFLKLAEERPAVRVRRIR